MSDVPEPEALTRFLNQLGNGASDDPTRLMSILYAELRAIAEGCLRGERPGHTLQATALVHEAYVKLFDPRQVEWKGRKHFYVVAAKVMRRLLVDQARRRKRRGRDRNPPTLDLAIAAASGIPVDLIDLDAALDELAALDERQSRVVELKYFGGLEVADVARVLDASVTTVERDWRSARAWLASRLGGDPD
jgi:RNA polymerase sigma factor (TIGR02999 family)